MAVSGVPTGRLFSGYILPGVETPGYYQLFRDKELSPVMERVLIIAYGNPLRSDDGVALRVAEQLEAKFSADDVEIVRPQQLGPELAEAASRSRLVIFVDAAAGTGEPGAIQIRELSAGGSEMKASVFGHAIPPVAVIGLARQLYGASPKAYSATVVGESFEHGELLSSIVNAAVPLIVERIRELIVDEQAGEANLSG